MAHRDRVIPQDLQIKQRQFAGLWLDGQKTILNESDAVRFIRSVGFALRYNASSSLPLAAIFGASHDKRRGIELTNQLLAKRVVVETNVIADRLMLVHTDLVPMVYALRVRRRQPSLSPDAERALDLIKRESHVTAGGVRRYLGVTGLKRPDSADLALAELQREMLIDRGPSSVPKRGIPYLSPEGFPYRIFEQAHADLVRAAGNVEPADAICVIIEAYLRAAVFAVPTKLAVMFRLLMNVSEIADAVAALMRANKVSKQGKYILHRAPSA